MSSSFVAESRSIFIVIPFLKQNSFACYLTNMFGYLRHIPRIVSGNKIQLYGVGFVGGNGGITQVLML